ncbi:MAG: hypothetical protein V5A37_02055 [Halobacteriales archaeon]
MQDHRRLLAGLFAAFGLLAAAALWEVLGTVFFAITVVYVVEPAYDRSASGDSRPGWPRE